MTGACLAAAVFAALALGAPGAARAAPIGTDAASHRISLKVRRVKAAVQILETKVTAHASADSITWTYLPDTSVSIPFVRFELDGIPANRGLVVLVEKLGKLGADATGRYPVGIPLLAREQTLRISVIDDRGRAEDWEIKIGVSLPQSAVFVDETCRDYLLRIKEVERPQEGNLIYVGCRAGSSPHHLSLDIYWGDVRRVTYHEQTVSVNNSLITLPLEHRRRTKSAFSGVDGLGRLSVYTIDYDPVIPTPFEVWAGLAFFRTAFEQSNFPAEFSQVSSAFLGKLWYRPEDIDLSLMVRGFGSALSFSNSLDPDQGYDESVKTYFLSGEARYRVLHRGGWGLSPFFGGWMFFMKVESRRFGIQRIVTPLFGVTLERELSKRNRLEAALRLVPLQTFFNPFEFQLNQMYTELEFTFVHEFRSQNRFFGTLYYGNLSFTPESLARTAGSYLVIGGGYGW